MPGEPSEREEQYFKEQELKQRLQQSGAQQQKAAAEEKQRFKDLHWMHCPKCGQSLLTEKHGAVDVDVCPSCRGLWLDASELDTILASTQKTGPLRSFLKILGK